MKYDINYYDEYLFRNIKLKDIPLSKMNIEILRLGAIREPDAYVDVILKLYEVDGTIDLVKLASLLMKDCFQCYEMYDRIFDIEPLKYFDLIPDKYKTGRMWNKMLELDRAKYFDLMPPQYRTRELVYEMMEKDGSKYFDEIQKNFYDSKKNIVVSVPFDEQLKLNKLLFDADPKKFFEYLIDKEMFRF